MQHWILPSICKHLGYIARPVSLPYAYGSPTQKMYAHTYHCPTASCHLLILHNMNQAL